MHTEANLTVEPRTELGSLATRRLRRQKRVPVNIYGHNQAATNTHCCVVQVTDIIRNKVRIVNVTAGGQTDKCMVQDVQWDAFGDVLLHVDFLRVDPNERVTVEVPIEFRGNAVGVLRGGIMDYGLRKLSISCLAYMVPDSLQVRIGALDIDQAIHVKDVELFEGLTCNNPADATVVRVLHVDAAKALAATTASEVTGAGPEVIGKKVTDEDADAKAGDKGGKGKK